MSYDNICKYLAEKYPAAFVQWLLATDPDNIRILKTELGLEPIRADSLTFLQTDDRILHIEFQTSAISDPPLPFRMLDYSVRLKRKYRSEVEQVIVFLQETTNSIAYTEIYQDSTTTHQYRVIRLWEQNPTLFLSNPALLPLASLTKTDSPSALLRQVMAEVAKIEEESQQKNIAACLGILASLRFDTDLIQQLLRANVMREAPLFQEILQEGRQEGRQEGKQEEAVNMITRQLTRRFGTISPQLQEQIQKLSVPQLEDLGEALLDFEDITDLTTWLNQHSS